MPFLPIAIAAGAAQSIYQIGQGISQKAKSNRMNPERPTYEIPGQVTQATELAQRAYADPRLSGQSLYEMQIEGDQAKNYGQAKRAAGSSAALMEFIQSGGERAERQKGELAIAAANQQVMERRELQQALQTEAGYEDKAWAYNEKSLFEEESAAKAALYESGSKNIFQGIGRAGQGAMSLYDAQNSGMLDDIFKKTGTDDTLGLNTEMPDELMFNPVGGLSTLAQLRASVPKIGIDEEDLIKSTINPF